MSMLQKTRLLLEKGYRVSIVLCLVMFGLLGGFYATESTWFLFTLVFVLLFSLSFIFFICHKTDHWWYEEYEDNKWGKMREIIEAVSNLKVK